MLKLYLYIADSPPNEQIRKQNCARQNRTEEIKPNRTEEVKTLNKLQYREETKQAHILMFIQTADEIVVNQIL